MVETMDHDFERNKASVQQTSLQFIETELELARTFCKTSQETKDAQKRARNLRNAKRALQSATKAFRAFSEPGDDWTKVKANLDQVERELACVR